MEREQVLAKLREHEQELRAAGILTLSLFGSLARGEADEQSDVDLMAAFDAEAKLSVLGVVGLENRVSDILGVKAELTNRKMLKPHVAQRAAREAMRVF